MAWQDATRHGTSERSTFKKRRAAVLGARANITEWLASQIANPPPDAHAAIEELCGQVGDALAGKVMKAIEKQLKTAKDTGIAVADHFFCGLLAEFAHAVDTVGDAFDHVFGKIKDAIIDSRASEHRQGISYLLVELAIDAFATALKEILSRLSLVGHIEDLQRAMRIVAVFLCPDPVRHEAVMDYCLKPLGQVILSDAIRQRLIMSLPARMTSGGDSAPPIAPAQTPLA